MNGPFTLHWQPKHLNPALRVAMPANPVLTLGVPRIGECLVIVGQDGVVQTSTVKGCRTTQRGIVVDTANSSYTLRAVQAEGGDPRELAATG